MALATVTTRQKTAPLGSPKNTKIKAPKAQAKSVVSSLLAPTVSPYDFLSERITGIDIKIDATKNELSERITSVDKKIDLVEKNLNTRIDALDEKLTTRIDGLEKNMNTRIDATNIRIDGLENSMNTRIDSLEKSMSRSFTMLTIVMAFVGIGLALLQIFGN